MSKQQRVQSLLVRLIVIVITGGLCAGAWWLWNEVPRLLRGTEFVDYRYLASLVVIFFILSLINPVIRWFWDRFNNNS